MLAHRGIRWSAGRYGAATRLTVLAFMALLPAEGLESAAVERSIVVREHSGWNRDCQAIAPPPLFLIVPPSHGKVCAKAQVITITSMYAGTESQCIGREVSGMSLIYQPDALYDGEDALIYGVQYPSRFRAISVKMSISPTVPPMVSSADTDANLVAQSRQTSGLMPVCPQHIF